MCEKCQGTGLLPHIKPDGTVSTYARIFCPDCYDPYGNVYPYALKPSDFDCSVSYSVYRSLCQEHGWQDPGPDTPEASQSHIEGRRRGKQEVIHRHSDMSRQDFAKLQDLIGQVACLQNKITGLSRPGEKKPGSRYGYRGIK